MRNATFFSFFLTLVTILTGGFLSAQCINFNGDMEIANDPANDFPSGYYDYSDGTITSSVISPAPDGSGMAATSTQSGGNFAGYAIGVTGIIAGETYNFSIDVEVTSAAIDFANIYISWRNAAGMEIGTEFSGNANPGDGVVTLTTSGTAPTDTEQLQIAVNFRNGTVVMDNFCVEASTPGNGFDCAGNLVGNGSLDNDAGGWIDYNNGDAPTMSTADAFAGPMAGTWPGGGVAATFFSAGVTPGNFIRVSGQLKSANGEILVIFQKQNGTQCFSATGPSGSATEYQAVSTGQIVVPEGTTQIGIVAQSNSGQPGTFDNICVVDEGPDPNFTFPVVLSAFTGQAMNKYNQISWTTATEENTAMFYLERSADGRNDWTTINEVTATGNSRVEVSYGTRDETPLGQGFYRLRSVDFDGTDELSDVIVIKRQDAAGIIAYPNPFRSEVNLATDLEAAGEYQLVDALGRKLRQGRIAAGYQQTTIQTADLPSGRYLLRVGDQTVSIVK